MNVASFPTMIIKSGLPASGKTTESKAWVDEDPTQRWRVNYDDLRRQMFGPSWKFNRQDENKMQDEARKQAAAALSLGKSVVIDNTNLTERTRNKWAALGKQFGAEVMYEELDTPVWECVRRDYSRSAETRVGRAVIERMALFYGFIDWGNPEIYQPTKKFVVVDMDGTLADCEHRRHYVRPVFPPHTFGCANATTHGNNERCPALGCAANIKPPKKDWPAFFRECSADTPIEPIAQLVHTLSKEHYILIVSGRPMDKCGIATEDWLYKFAIPVHHLFMRDNGDSRDDTIVKREIAELLPLERVAYVIDDRPKVLRMWRELGLTTLAVGDGKEF